MGSLPERTLGPLAVSALGLGCMGMSQAYGATEGVESRATLARALDLGVTFYDTANVYGMGHNEKLLSRFLAAHRDEVQLATKFGITRGADGKRGVDGSPENVRQSCEASLGRLEIEVIDLYY